MQYCAAEVLWAAVEEAFTQETTDHYAEHLPEHGAKFNCATTMKVSILMF
jgi:hypothetical protein